MEDIPEVSNEKLPIPFEESLRVATDLLARYPETGKMGAPPENELSDEERGLLDFGKNGISHFLKPIPHSLQERFKGHGIYGKDDQGNLAVLINILQNKAIKGWASPLKNSGWQDTKMADFLVLSHIDKPLKDEGESRNAIGFVAKPGAYVLDVKFYPVIDELRRMFPDANIIHASDVGDYMQQQLDSKAV